MTEASRWLVFGASVRGPDHERDGRPSQDRWASAAAGDGMILCLCDGAGSASHAEIGAEVVVSAVLDALRGVSAEALHALPEAVAAACEAGREALLREAAARSLAPSDLACTLVAAAAWEDLAVTAHIGDGAVIARRRGSGELFLASAPDRGEHADETWFITAASWRSRLRVSLHEGVDALCAFTDGCQEASLVRGRTLGVHAPFCAPIFEFAAEVLDPAAACDEVSRLLDGEAMRRSSGDDKTLAVALRTP